MVDGIDGADTCDATGMCLDLDPDTGEVRAEFAADYALARKKKRADCPVDPPSPVQDAIRRDPPLVRHTSP